MPSRGARAHASAALGVALGLLAGCSTPREIPPADDPDFCFDCHGAPANGNAAPPPAFWRDGSEPVDPHQTHLGPSDTHAEIACTECHVVPERVRDEGHVDSERPAELTWGTLAAADGAAPSFDGTRCSNVYCHGATLLPGGSNVEPAWDVGNGEEAACGTCHGLPPDPPHVPTMDCGRCHPTANADQEIVEPALHVNGIVEVEDLECDGCHGSDGVAAPPVDLMGNVETSARGVGAHRAHLDASTWRAEIGCEQCHVVPVEADDPGHLDSATPAELTWGSLAAAGGAVPSFDGTSCAGVYCHGATLEPGGTNTMPVWTAVGTGEADCGTCHGLPPGGSHPPYPFCGKCHPTADDTMAIVAPALHVNGVVELNAFGCTDCHGSPASPAPPVSVGGLVATTERGVGAHAAHVADSTWHVTVACGECHLVPAGALDPGHFDSPLPAELTWGALATADGAAPSWDGSTCTVYCHGSTLFPGGSNTSPTWTLVGSGQAACGACHSTPPGPPHRTGTGCFLCHPTIDNEMNINMPDLHVDGIVETMTMHPAGWASPTMHGAAYLADTEVCRLCHGTDLLGGLTGIRCDECHALP